MELVDIVTIHRNTYIRQLKEFYEDKNEGIKEVLLKLNNEKSGLLLNLTRSDYLVKVNEEWKIVELSPDSFNTHSPVEFKFGNTTVELNPIFWHGCQFTMTHTETDNGWLEEWTKKWIDEDDNFESIDDGLSGAIHNVTILTQVEEGWQFIVDFGTAPVESFMELIDVLNKKGISNVIVHSSDLMEE
jgi:hypothetical protein